MKNSRANRITTQGAVRCFFNDHNITFTGRRWEFDRDGDKIIVRSSDHSKTYDMNFQSEFEGYDYTMNIRFSDEGNEVKIVKQTRQL